MVSNAFDRPTGGPSLDRILGVLADERRRDVLNYLLDGTADTASVSTLADHLAESDSGEVSGTGETEEGARSENSGTTGREQAIAIELRHVHLPKLDAAEVVEYAPESETVEYEGVEAAEALLDATTEEN